MLSVRADTFSQPRTTATEQVNGAATCLFRSKLVPFAEALLIASKEIGLEVNAEKTKYMVMSRDQNAGQNGYIQIGNKSFETVEQFKYL
jgi:hypothetical protein